MIATEVREAPPAAAAPAPASRRFSWALLSVWTVFALWALLQSDPTRLPVVPVSVGHAILFLGPTLAVLGLAQRADRRRVAVVLLVLAALASEALQELVTAQRHAEWIDIAGDLGGVVAGLGVSMVLRRIAGGDDLAHTRLSAIVAAALLVVSSGVIGWTSDTARQWRECQGVELDPVDAPLGPVVVGDGRGELLGDSTGLRCALLGRDGFSVAAVVTPARIDSDGPTRIVTSSVGIESDQYNLHLGQEGDALSFRVRTGKQAYREWHLVSGVFEAGRRHRIVVSVDGADATVMVDGRIVTVIELRASSVAAWDPDYPVLIGDELIGQRRFDGTIEQVAIFDRPLEPSEAEVYGIR